FPNGDLVNKIGTSQVALISREHAVPFYSAASLLKMAPEGFSKDELIIEMRPEEEVAPPEEYPGVSILNPAFDLTPSEHINGFITEWGVLKPQELSDYTFSAEKVLTLLDEGE
ncbi:MAG: ribose 1,5-bisphosphate isomerase, partial [Thermoplasmata archaeon]|nr:ribose 1,5-bisphosphate isomerase [Thermoplasmata archaeon]